MVSPSEIRLRLQRTFAVMDSVGEDESAHDAADVNCLVGAEVLRELHVVLRKGETEEEYNWCIEQTPGMLLT